MSAKVPCSTVARLRLGTLESAGKVRAGTVDSECGKHVPAWKRNCSRDTWSFFNRYKLGWKVKPDTFQYNAGDGNVVSIAFLSPKKLLKYMIERHPDVLVGGLQCPQERAIHLQAFWEGFRLQHPDHVVFQEHNDALSYVFPLYHHGDEGRGKRRGNTVVVSLETPIGITTVDYVRKRQRQSCNCTTPAAFSHKYPGVHGALPPHLKTALKDQRTNMKGHSFIQHFPVFIIPSAYHHAYPDLLKAMLGRLALELKELFYEGVYACGRQWCASVCGAKGDLKWYTKIAHLKRSYEHQGYVQDILCCHQCLAGDPNGTMPYEDVSEAPSWAATRWKERPWLLETPPPLLAVPCWTLAPEKQYKTDPFHTMKTGIFRDLVGSCICYMARNNLFSNDRDFPSQLNAAHGAFRLFCLATGETAALRSFSRALMVYPRFSAFPWANVKGSDSMLLCKWLVHQCTALQNDETCGADPHCLKLMKATCRAALDLWANFNKHGLFLPRTCGMVVYAEMTRFINGYNALANFSLNDDFNGWGMKPKLHLLKHAALELHEDLVSGKEFLPNFNVHNCEQNEDYVGRMSRLSRRLDSRTVCERAIASSLLKGGILHKRWKRTQVNR